MGTSVSPCQHAVVEQADADALPQGVAAQVEFETKT